VKQLVVLLAGAIWICGVARAEPDAFGLNRPIGPMKVAVTVDDLPEHGDELPGSTREDIARGVLKALKQNGATQAFGFANGGFFDHRPTEIDVLKDWLLAGYPIGNHTYSHMDLDQVTAPEFIADISKQDSLMATLSSVSRQPIKQRRMFRYPYLDEGNTLEKRNAVRNYLFKNGYRIAEVSIDYNDWAWNRAYIQCLAKKDQKSVDWLKGHVLDDAERHFREASAFAQELFGRNIVHILLLHDSALNSTMLDVILADLRAKSVRIVTLDEALRDPTYALNPNTTDRGRTFLEQVAESRGVDPNPFIDKLYPVKKLLNVCK
jgi:peptidoglycan/xylan/chitin deacetylase (PgdA/CDA1 family)